MTADQTPTPAEVQEAWLADACSVIGQHCGSDGLDDEHNDWINDLANALWDTLVKHPVERAEVDLANLRGAVAGVRAEFEQAVADPDLDAGVASWLDALSAHLAAAVGPRADMRMALDDLPDKFYDAEATLERALLDVPIPTEETRPMGDTEPSSRPLPPGDQ